MKFSAKSAGLSAVVDVFGQTDLFETLTNADVLRLSRLGSHSGFSSVEAIRKSTGISQRRLLKDGLTAADLGFRLCRHLEQSTGLQMADFTEILLCHSSTNSLACRELADELTLRLQLPVGRIVAFNHGCSGFLKMMTEGAAILESHGPDARVALLSVETPEFWHDASDRLFCGIVSAGATAAVLEFGRGWPLNIVNSGDFQIAPDRRINSNPLFQKEATDAFDFRGRPVYRTVMRMNAEPVFLNGIELMLNNLNAALMSFDRQPGERIIVAPHQPSGKLLKALIATAKTEHPDLEFLNNLESYGNTISASVPTLLSRLDEILEKNQLQPLRNGDHLILLAAGICMPRIEDQMSAGYACLTWQNQAAPLHVSHQTSMR